MTVVRARASTDVYTMAFGLLLAECSWILYMRHTTILSKPICHRLTTKGGGSSVPDNTVKSTHQ